MLKEITSRNRNKNTTLYCIKKLIKFLMINDTARRRWKFFRTKIFDKHRHDAVFIENRK